jgi:methionine-rich copper-binding protein CopC
MKKALRPLLVLALVTPALAFAACGSSSTGGATPQGDAGPGDSGPGEVGVEAGPDAVTPDAIGGDADADSADAPEVADAPASAVTLISSTPADGALHVSLVDPIRLVFSGPLLPASVSTTSVRILAPNATAPMTATVTYDDATHTVTLVPKVALAVASDYRVVASGLQAADGVVADAKISFTTLYDSVIDVKRVDMADSSKVTGLTLYTRDAQGRTTMVVGYYPGPDGVCGTSDDVPYWWQTTSYPAGGMEIRNYTGAGADHEWLTADDWLTKLTRYYASAPFGRTRYADFSNPGVDGTWGTDDDSLTGANEILWAPDGLEASATLVDGRGADGTLFTADDRLRSYFVDQHVGDKARRIEYGGPGLDGIWHTADDLVASVFDTAYDADGRLVAEANWAKGSDNVFLTADDKITALRVSTYDAVGLLARVTTYWGAGADKTWGTADDVVMNYSAYEHDANGAVRTRSSYDSGPDGVWFTADDVVFEIERHDTTK